MIPGLTILRNPGISVSNKIVYPIILRDIAAAVERGERGGKLFLKTSSDTMEFGTWRILDDRDDFDAVAESNTSNEPQPARLGSGGLPPIDESQSGASQ